MQGASPPPKAPQPLGKAHGPQADLENRDGVPNRGSDAMGAPIIDLAPKIQMALDVRIIKPGRGSIVRAGQPFMSDGTGLK